MGRRETTDPGSESELLTQRLWYGLEQPLKSGSAASGRIDFGALDQVLRACVKDALESARTKPTAKDKKDAKMRTRQQAQRQNKERKGKEQRRPKEGKEQVEARAEVCEVTVTRGMLRKAVADSTRALPESAKERLASLGFKRCAKCKSVYKTCHFEHTKVGKRVISSVCNLCRRARASFSDPLSYYARYLVRLSRARAKKLGIPHDIDHHFVEARFREQDGRCALCGRRVTLFHHPDARLSPDQRRRGHHFHVRNISLDQIVPQGGYTTDNVQIVDRNCNFAKSNMTDAEFIEMCRYVVRTHGAQIQGEDPYERQEEVTLPPDFEFRA